MRAEKFAKTLDKNPPTEPSVLFPLSAIEALQRDPLFVESDDEGDDDELISTVAPSLQAAHTGADPGRITDEDIEESSADEGVEIPSLSGGTSLNIVCTKKRRTKIGGRQPKHHKKAKVPAVIQERDGMIVLTSTFPSARILN